MDRNTLILRLALLAAVVWLGACEPADLGGRFEAEILLEGRDAPRQPTRLRFFPTGNEFLVTTKKGRVHHFRLADDGVESLGTFRVPGVEPAPSDLGLTDVLFDPLFASTQRIYFSFTTADNKTNRIVMMEWQDDYQAISTSLQPVIEIARRHRGKASRGSNSIEFGSDRFLYAAMDAASETSASQNPETLLGKLIRIEPLATGLYRIPPDNPNYGVEGVRDEIVATGLQSPSRIVPWKDYFFISDLGTRSHDEINLYSSENQNFGWPDCEGLCDNEGLRDPEIAVPIDGGPFVLEDPVPSTSSRTALMLGVVYESSDGPYDGLLDRHLLFSDFHRGYVRAARVGTRARLGESQHLLHLEGVTSMDVGPDGYIYGTKKSKGAIFRIVVSGGSAE